MLNNIPGPLYMVDYTPIRTIEVTNLEDDVGFLLLQQWARINLWIEIFNDFHRQPQNIFVDSSKVKWDRYPTFRSNITGTINESESVMLHS